MDDPWKANREPCGNIFARRSGQPEESSRRDNVVLQRLSTRIIRASRESARNSRREQLVMPEPRSIVGTGTFPRACASIIYSALSRKSLTSTASAVSVPTTIFTPWPMPRSRGTCDASKAPADWKSSLVTLRMCKEQNGSRHRHDSGVSHTGDEYDRYARISDIRRLTYAWRCSSRANVRFALNCESYMHVT